MRIDKHTILLVPVLCAVTIFIATSAAAQSEKLSFTGTDYYDHWISPGTWTCPAEAPPGGWPPCPEGNRIRMRDAVFASNFTSPQLGRADGIIVMNANDAPDNSGPMWGTVSMVFWDGLLSGSSCEGVWTGKESVSLLDGNPVWFATVNGVMHCSGGSFDGSTLKLAETFSTSQPDPIGITSTVKGRLLDPEDN